MRGEAIRACAATIGNSPRTRAPADAQPLMGGILLAVVCLSLVTTRAGADERPVVSKAPVRRIAWHPSGRQVTYLRRIDSENSPREALFAYHLDTAAEVLLIDPKARPLPAGEERAAWSLSDYQWSPTGKAVLVSGGGDLWLVPVGSGAAQRLTRDEPREENPVFSPDGSRVAFVKGGNLFVVECASATAAQLTHDGGTLILNGTLDWVYGEEFRDVTGGDRAFEWSPDSRRIALLRLDQSRVPEYVLTDFLPTHSTVTRQRYPQPGDPNAAPGVLVVDACSGGTACRMPLEPTTEYVLPEFNWSPDGATVYVMTLNRSQNELSVRGWKPGDGGAPCVLLEEKDPAWLNVFEGPRFLSRGDEFVWLSERDGWNHAYLYDSSGGCRRQLTRGQWQIEPNLSIGWTGRPFEIDRAGEWIYFSATEADPRERHVYRAQVHGERFERLSREPGTHFQKLSPDGGHLVISTSSTEIPHAVSIARADGTQVVTLYRANPPDSKPDSATVEAHEVTLADGTTLYARLIKPADFDPSRKYPVVVDVYGGPQLQVVRNVWGAPSSLQRRLVKEGFLVWSLDNRGSWGRGHAWETSIFKNLGARELADQLEGVAYLKKFPWVDAERFGIRGWSYGGYMTLYAMTNAPDVFRCGVAGAPVTDWKLYDTIYTERYMRTPAENPEGYRRASPVSTAENLKGRLLLIHGTSDDNVHMQNSLAFLHALIENGKPCELQIQPGQRHGFGGEKSNRFLTDQIVEFFKRHL